MLPISYDVVYVLIIEAINSYKNKVGKYEIPLSGFCTLFLYSYTI